MLPTLAHRPHRVGRCPAMRRRLYLGTGVPLAVAGFGCALVSLALPWARYHVTGTAVANQPVASDGSVAVFGVGGGTWYLLAVLALAGLFAGAVLGGPRGRPVISVVASVGGLVTALLVAVLVRPAVGGVVAAGRAEVHVTMTPGPGTRFGLVAGPLLGIGAALVAAGRGDVNRKDRRLD